MSSFAPPEITLRIFSEFQSIQVLAHLDKKIDSSILRTSVASSLGNRILPIPKARECSMLIPGAGLITPKKWAKLKFDVPELGVVGETMSVQLAEWETSLPDMYIAQRLFDKLSTQVLETPSAAPENKIDVFFTNVEPADEAAPLHQLPPHVTLVLDKISEISISGNSDASGIKTT
ncbi:hypothetical protein B0T21DRAFT_362066 [Apiosordaria backusii]|uniref:Uncharacterized protein n=1 Tax=Apiosordaria backusii TaxID=314023 RepID=A0AA40BRN5_9PEZI|nr:hypothetical protein B0T21DRAFT_362066 [Apiosordaria backusii]